MGEHVFEGEPDARQQLAGEDVKVSRFRPRYRNLTKDEKDLHDAIKARAEHLCEAVELVKAGRYRSLAITHLEISVMLAIKELTS